MPIARIAAVAVAYFATAKLGISLDVAEGVVTPVWVPTGLALAALLLFGYGVWPGIALGAFVANATSDVGVATAAGIAVGNTLEGVSGTYLLRRIRDFSEALDRARDVLAIVIVGAAVSTVAATIGSTSLLLGDEIAGADYRSTWFLWWFGDAIGALTVAPLILTWASHRNRHVPRARVVEGAILLAALIVVGVIVFSGDRWRFPYVIFPLLVWAAVRFDVRGAATANFVVPAIAVLATVGGSVLIEDATPTQTVQILQSLIAVVAVSMLLAAATIGERTRAEEALSSSLSLLQATLDSTADGVVVVDLKGHIVSFNQRFVEMWRIPPDVIDAGDEDVVQRFVLDQLADPSAFLARVQQVYAQPTQESTDVLLFKDGRVFERFSLPQRLGNEVIGRVWSFRDVTDARRSEVLKGRFLDMAGHEMRNPLGVITSFAGVLDLDWDSLGDDTKREYVQRMSNQADKLLHLVDALLLTSRADAGKLDPRVTSIELVAALREVTTNRPAGSIHVEGAESVVVRADPDYLRNMIENYLTNAEKYGRPPISVAVTAEDGDAHVRVRDSGDGIPSELVGQLFERFSPTREALNPRAPGTGLGLWIVRELARAQGGDAWYEPSPDGPEFCFRLPLATAAP